MEKKWCIGPLQIVREQHIEEEHYAVIQGRKIVQICKQNQLPSNSELYLTKPTYKLMPGMIDQHIHGIAGEVQG